jgi:hypothetical protein
MFGAADRKMPVEPRLFGTAVPFRLDLVAKLACVDILHIGLERAAIDILDAVRAAVALAGHHEFATAMSAAAPAVSLAPPCPPLLVVNRNGMPCR